MSYLQQRLRAALADRYRIERELGEGGMATVYLARDERHDRQVAIKVLKPELAALVGAERFLAEIRTTANLRHPHILPLFDSGEADGFLYYVMPYVEGETLRERLDREKQLPVEGAVEIVRRVAAALQAAHDVGVIHRDIKPANILLERGEPLVSDFGIALAMTTAGDGRLTETGLSLGTPNYMSPEQATADRAPDARSDQYALACVLYEMLTGDPPFTGSTVQAVLVRILTEAPRDVVAVRASVPGHVAGALAKAMEKLPADRFPRIDGFAEALGDPGFRFQSGGTGSAPAPETGGAPASWTGQVPWRTAAPWVLAVLFAGVSAVLAFRSTGDGGVSPSSVRASLDLGSLQLTGTERIEVAPTGDRFVVSAVLNGERALYFRYAQDERFVPLPGTEGGSDPVFSPDGGRIAFTTDRVAVSVVDVGGGAPRRLAEEGRDPAWTSDGRIVFARRDGLYAVPENGGAPQLLTTAGAGLWDVTLLPGGRAAMGSTREGQEVQVRFVDLEADRTWVLVSNAMSARLVGPGRLLYADRSGGVWLTSFDPDQGALTGPAVPVLDGVAIRNGYFARYAVADDGTLVYTPGEATADQPAALGVLELDGSLERVPRPVPDEIFDPVWDPSGERVAFMGVSPAGTRVMIFDALGRSRPTTLTTEGGVRRPIWSPDGERIVFASSQEGTDGFDLFVVETTGAGVPEQLVSLPGGQLPSDWSSEELIVFETAIFSDSPELWIADLSSGDSVTARPYLAPPGGARKGVLDPSGRWVAYWAVEADRVEVRAFPEPRESIVISDFPSGRPAWSATGD
ncbi:MAG: protein kinase, partial [Gemmatimonadales bacterium]